jgi:hypothetical protein
MDPHEAVASSSFSGSNDNEGIPCSDFPCNTQPVGKFFWSFVSPSSIIKDCSNNFQSIFQNRHFFSYYSMIPLPLIINPIKPYMTQNSDFIYTLSAYTLLYKSLSVFTCFVRNGTLFKFLYREESFL